jgi:uncharacterized protein
MIVYTSDKAGFRTDVEHGRIDQVILNNFKRAFGHSVAKNEVRAWHQSLTYMNTVLNDQDIPEDVGVSIELRIPQTAKRIDFLLTGQDEDEVDHAVIVELKQWESAEVTDLDGVVETWVGGAKRKVSHPSYQAWSYAALLQDFNQAVYDGRIELRPCAYLHNFEECGVLDDERYGPHVERAPLFLKHGIPKLREFIKRYVKHGDRGEAIYRIESGRIRPSKKLADSVAGLMEGNEEFVMIDDQKVVLESALDLARRTSNDGEKRVLIVEGGPGTGKSVVALNLLVALTRQRDLAKYVTRNGAPRAVFESRLTGTMTRTRFSNLFSGSGAFVTAEAGTFDVLIVDEAHRLNEKSGLYQNLGENQVKELIEAANLTVFFIDEDQRVTLRDIGTKGEIVHWARHFGAEVHEMELESQFRCNGSDGYLAWIDHVLGIRSTAHPDLSGVDYDFRVCSTPNELRDLIRDRNEKVGPSRLVAGYCWRWKSKKDKNAFDIEFPAHDFRMRWNLDQDGPLWILKPSSINEIGCIHTCQGLELDYVGVIIGPDLVVRDGEIVTRPEARDRYDSSIRGYKKRLRADPEGARRDARAVILNTYRTLMTRGMKGCYVYCVDGGLAEHLRVYAGREGEG